MSQQITVTLPEAVIEQADAWARCTGLPIEEFLAETIASSLTPLGKPNAENPIDTWSDKEVLAVSQLQMSPEQNQRLSVLLGDQRQRELNDNERTELTGLMQAYQIGLVRKAKALREAVKRGLLEPLQP